jgi:flagellar hook assembly protein FlgD
LATKIELRVYGARGELVRTLCSGFQPAGEHQLVWDGRDDAGRRVGSGAYLCRMTAGDFRATVKLAVVR